ncbi:hypothetical protein [Paenibacillus durus]|uniref:Bacteriophage SP-beta YorD domain-containing protein n=1 Tax=Paenibacillus durus ATCC 35681 TaxID=1333534 RepID=A0A0F7CJE1_PAEDU|nr:hypothetical protein [Paenibacillus durus]AKG36076.1 hypothetical protein VK70_17185 [Paenibacillus durus ATCC 35681]
MSYFLAYDVREEVGHITAIYYDRANIEGIEGIAVENLPVPENNGLIPQLKVNLSDNTLYYDYASPPLSENAQIAALQEELTGTQLALADNYEQMLAAQQDATNAQLALADLYELTLSLQTEVAALKGGGS